MSTTSWLLHIKSEYCRYFATACKKLRQLHTKQLAVPSAEEKAAASWEHWFLFLRKGFFKQEYSTVMSNAIYNEMLTVKSTVLVYEIQIPP